MRNVAEAPPSVYRFSERCFRRYEPYIKRALELFPDSLVIELEVTAQSTFVLRCRDSIRSLLHNEWETIIDVSLLVKHLPSFFVMEDGADCARLGPRDKITRHIKAKESEIIAPHATTLRDRPFFKLESPTDEQLTAALILANATFFQQIPVLVTGVSPQQKVYIDTCQYSERYPNVVFDPDTANQFNYTLL